jgi:hypothetical protein
MSQPELPVAGWPPTAVARIHELHSFASLEYSAPSPTGTLTKQSVLTRVAAVDLWDKLRMFSSPPRLTPPAQTTDTRPLANAHEEKGVLPGTEKGSPSRPRTRHVPILLSPQVLTCPGHDI